MTFKRTHHCGELTKKDNEQVVTLCGWVSKRRDHGGIIFIDFIMSTVPRVSFGVKKGETAI